MQHNIIMYISMNIHLITKFTNMNLVEIGEMPHLLQSSKIVVIVFNISNVNNFRNMLGML